MHRCGDHRLRHHRHRAKLNGSGSTSRISSYSCAPGTYAGNEFAYRFTGGSEPARLRGDLWPERQPRTFPSRRRDWPECLSSSCGAYSDAVTTAGAEALGFNTVPGQDYYLVVDGPLARNYSMSVQCTTIDGCQPVKPIEPGQSISATNNPASAASNVTASKVPTYFGPTFSIPESGPEAAWIFTPTVTANYRVTVSNLSQDCDAFVLTGVDCAGTLLGATTYSDNFGTIDRDRQLPRRSEHHILHRGRRLRRRHLYFHHRLDAAVSELRTAEAASYIDEPACAWKAWTVCPRVLPPGRSLRTAMRWFAASARGAWARFTRSFISRPSGGARSR